MQRGVALAVKRVLDVGAALLGLALAAPVMIVVALLIRLRMGSPVLFRQQRTGYRGRRFTILKFRTMQHKTGQDGRLLSDQERSTRLGRVLRRLSLDELPQLINIVQGEMSLVGPRPWLPKYDHWYSPNERRRFDVRPGITGLAQVAGRNTVGWSLRLSYDVEYVERWSLWLDFMIGVKTIRAVLTRRGVADDQRDLMDDLDDERGLAQTDEMILSPSELMLLGRPARSSRAPGGR